MSIKLEEDLKRYKVLREHAFVDYFGAHKNGEPNQLVDKLESIVISYDHIIRELENIMKNLNKQT